VTGVDRDGERPGQRLRRRAYHFARHPWRWTRYLVEHEVRKREVVFGRNPRFLDYRPMYRVSRPGLVRLTGRPALELDAFFAELEPLRTSLVREVANEPTAGALAQAPLLYLLVRAMRPTSLVETGVSSGYSSRFILEALDRNESGRLHSVGIARFPLAPNASDLLERMRDRPIGWLVPDRLRTRWDVRIGPSDELLPALLGSDAARLDFFLHDSYHTYDTMRREYALAMSRLVSGGLLMSHDIHNNRAWSEFVRERRLAPAVELDRDLGAARVP
jgi:hypothetical protein